MWNPRQKPPHKRVGVRRDSAVRMRRPRWAFDPVQVSTAPGVFRAFLGMEMVNSAM